MRPAVSMTAATTTVPWARVATAIAGYRGWMGTTSWPAATPDDTWMGPPGFAARMLGAGVAGPSAPAFRGLDPATPRSLPATNPGGAWSKMRGMPCGIRDGTAIVVST